MIFSTCSLVLHRLCVCVGLFVCLGLAKLSCFTLNPESEGSSTLKTGGVGLGPLGLDQRHEEFYKSPQLSKCSP